MAVLEVKVEAAEKTAKVVAIAAESTVSAPVAANDTGKPAVPSRGDMLAGRTYKLAWPESEHALYVTIKDLIEADESGRQVRAPFEMFVNSKNMKYFAWAVGLTSMVPAVLPPRRRCLVRGRGAAFRVRSSRRRLVRRPLRALAAGGDRRHRAEASGQDRGGSERFGAGCARSDPSGEGSGRRRHRRRPRKHRGRQGRASRQVLPEMQPADAHQRGCESCTDRGYSKCG